MTKICDQRVWVGMKSSHPWFSLNHLDEGTPARPIHVLNNLGLQFNAFMALPSISTDSVALPRPSLEESEVWMSSIR